MTTPDYHDAAEHRVLAVLFDHYGRARAIRVPDLAALVGVGPREVQAIVHRLRIEHAAPIASTSARPAGYFMAETAAEIEQFVREQRRKALGTLAAIAAVRRVALPELLGQLAIEMRAA
jgi:hypothetical protein